MTPPKCEECEKEGKKPERIYPGSTSVTDMGYAPYWDNEGNYHEHDPNVRVTGFSCSNEHRWTQNTDKPCPTCGNWWEK